jgi:hypothetical protein
VSRSPVASSIQTPKFLRLLHAPVCILTWPNQGSGNAPRSAQGEKVDED